MIRTAAFLFAGSLAIIASPALAQQDPAADDMIIVSGGAGAQLLPSFPGSDSYTVNPLVLGFTRREGEPLPFSAADDGFGFGVLGSRSVIDFGPVVQFVAKRDQTNAGAAIGNVGITVEPGAFVNLNLTDFLRVRVEGRRGIGGHEGWVGDAGFDLALRSGSETVIAIGPRVRMADTEYMRTYFGVTPAVSAATGLPVFTPRGGVRAIGVIGGITHQLSRSFGVFAYGGYDRLVGDAADSPIVQQLGSRDQFSAGLALYYSFRMRNPF